MGTWAKAHWAPLESGKTSLAGGKLEFLSTNGSSWLAVGHAWGCQFLGPSALPHVVLARSLDREQLYKSLAGTLVGSYRSIQSREDGLSVPWSKACAGLPSSTVHPLGFTFP